MVKVGAPPKAGTTPLVPPFHAYSGQRGLERAQFDLKSPAGRDAFLALAATADVVIESFRPGVVERLGIGYEAVRAVNPGVVYCSTSGYGQTGPAATRAGHDLNYLAAGGYLHMSERTAEGRPPLPGATVADIAAGGLHAAAAVLAALVGRGRTGEGTYLDVSVADGVLWMLSLYIDEYLATGEAPGPGHYILTGRYACYDVYPTGDGGWLAIGAIEPVFWANLCRLLGLERWIEHQSDDAVQDDIRADIRAALGGPAAGRVGGAAGRRRHVRGPRARHPRGRGRPPGRRPGCGGRGPPAGRRRALPPAGAPAGGHASPRRLRPARPDGHRHGRRCWPRPAWVPPRSRTCSPKG